jgi:hypothetical protein
MWDRWLGWGCVGFGCLGVRMKDAGVGAGQRGCGWLGVRLGVVHGLEGWWHGVLWMIAVWMILAVFPDLCVEEAAEEVVAGDAVEACGGEG